MRKMLFGLLVVIAVLGGAALALAVPAKKTLTRVTVDVQGMHCRACSDELQQDLAKMPGVAAVKVTLQPAQATASLDETTVAASQFVAAIAGHRQMMNHAKTYAAQLVLFVDAPECAGLVKMSADGANEMTTLLKAVKGVGSVSLDATGKVASVTFSNKAIVATPALTAALGASNRHFSVGFVAPTVTKQKAAPTNCTCPAGCAGGCGCGCK